MQQQIATYGFADSENNQLACATTKHSQALRFFLLALMDVTATRPGVRRCWSAQKISQSYRVHERLKLIVEYFIAIDEYSARSELTYLV
ncbi:hypothetical protein BQ8482_250028 [Mesorhizobium delmotii]|uniref:Uncharacterized protein n=1 Tax=Mesorhizobium delmotii TaxID=1631247 RepID=A0A2P9ALX6_9HYPH|nr:hypothetical protein BQ8482_250028 [Mesorhizobium delmotii]